MHVVAMYSGASSMAWAWEAQAVEHDSSPPVLSRRCPRAFHDRREVGSTLGGFLRCMHLQCKATTTYEYGTDRPSFCCVFPYLLVSVDSLCPSVTTGSSMARSPTSCAD
ncbi:unnamed protein product [Laminaria digitata]